MPRIFDNIEIATTSAGGTLQVIEVEVLCTT